MQPPKSNWSSKENNEQASNLDDFGAPNFQTNPFFFLDQNMPIQTTCQATSLMPSSFEIIRDNVRKATCQSWDASQKKKRPWNLEDGINRIPRICRIDRIDR